MRIHINSPIGIMIFPWCKKMYEHAVAFTFSTISSYLHVSRIPGISEIMWNSAFEMTWILTSKVEHCKHIATCFKNMELQKQPSRGVLRKRCSENMQQIYKRTPMPKCPCRTLMPLLSFLIFSVVIERDQ